ncbi:MAG: hypothetical protein M0P49_00985 [Bacilli bacterium]|nr:hypothetical protein [Bacilli bacterium]
MSQLTNLDMVHIDENHNYSDDLYQEFMRENADVIHEGVFTPIKKMDIAQVEKKITLSENKLKLIKEKREWWKRLSKNERGKEKTKNFAKAILIGMLAGILIPINISGVSFSAMLAANTTVTTQSIKLKPQILQDYEKTLTQIETVYKTQLNQLNTRKKELQNSTKHESSILSNLDNIKIV